MSQRQRQSLDSLLVAQSTPGIAFTPRARVRSSNGTRIPKRPEPFLQRQEAFEQRALNDCVLHDRRRRKMVCHRTAQIETGLRRDDAARRTPVRFSDRHRSTATTPAEALATLLLTLAAWPLSTLQVIGCTPILGDTGVTFQAGHLTAADTRLSTSTSSVGNATLLIASRGVDPLERNIIDAFLSGTSPPARPVGETR